MVLTVHKGIFLCTQGVLYLLKFGLRKTLCHTHTLESVSWGGDKIYPVWPGPCRAFLKFWVVVLLGMTA